MVFWVRPILSFKQKIPQTDVWDLHAWVWGLGRHCGVEYGMRGWMILQRSRRAVRDRKRESRRKDWIKGWA
jgi:hypothetical protein